jgi:NADH:ubiquinone oxidoreductase subunit 3 (subunit A)
MTNKNFVLRHRRHRREKGDPRECGAKPTGGTTYTLSINKIL